MTRRPTDPDRIHIAGRMAVRNRLTGEGMSLELAVRWCAAWEADGDCQGQERQSPDYWQHGTKWIYERCSARKAP